MACSGCDARRAWLKRKAKLAAQALAAVLKQKPPEVHPRVASGEFVEYLQPANVTPRLTQTGEDHVK